ncbi:MAG: cell division protein FtsQ [Mycobacterium sp.]|jgi:cell division protein FtsQ|nr:cell division protein FtsQ [Mycobacterium sp.]
MTEPTGASEATGRTLPGEVSEEAEGAEEFEGPRRKARREREERRAAEARARAIEEARREAKRKVTATSTATKPVGRGAVRGLRVLVWGLVAIVVTVGLGLVLYFTPLMSVRNFVVDGLRVLPQDEVVAAANVRTGTPLLQVDTNKVADRVAAIRRVASVRVQREYPSTLRVTVVERIAVAVKDFPDGSHQFDRDGVDFATGPPPPGVPYLDVENPGPSDPPTKAALQVLVALHPDVTVQLARIAAPSLASITLTLKDGRVVVWGTTDRTEEKAETLAALLTRPGHTYDVSSPDLPTVK